MELCDLVVLATELTSSVLDTFLLGLRDLGVLTYLRLQVSFDRRRRLKRNVNRLALDDYVLLRTDLHRVVRVRLCLSCEDADLNRLLRNLLLILNVDLCSLDRLERRVNAALVLDLRIERLNDDLLLLSCRAVVAARRPRRRRGSSTWSSPSYFLRAFLLLVGSC